MRVTLVIASLGPGGAERVLATIANHWVEVGWTVVLLTFQAAGQTIYNPLDRRIHVVSLDLLADSRSARAAVSNNLRRVLRLRRAIRESRPDVVLSFVDQANVVTLLATRGLGTPVVVSERTHPGHHPIGRVWTRLRRAIYPAATAVVTQTPAALEYFTGWSLRHATVLPNPVHPTGSSGSPDSRQVTAVGRLGPEKGFDVLLRAFARLAPECPDWSLVIWGEGPKRAELEALRDDLGLGGRVRLPGVTATPGDWRAETGLFVLSSRYEGFPNALAEAMAAGLPVVAADCRAGPREMVDDGRTGLLVPPDDPIALAEAMRRLMVDASLRTRLGTDARRSMGRFEATAVLSAWTDLMSRAAEGRLS
jgi:glycosyltransferase involved in cell wall biosynthesis